MNKRGVLVLVALLSVFGVSLFAVPTASSRTTKPPIMLIFHPGGWIFAGNDMDQAEQDAEARGFAPIRVAYPLFDVPAAFAQAELLAHGLTKRGRQVFAYGESAGGAMAAALAQKGEVQAAAVHSPVSDIPAFVGTLTGGNSSNRPFCDSLLKLTPTTERTFSPDSRRKPSKRGIFAVVPEEDHALSPTTLAWAARDPSIQVLSVPGGHLDPGSYTYALGQAMNFLRRQLLADQRQVKGRGDGSMARRVSRRWGSSAS